jgi:hypothetical protein
MTVFAAIAVAVLVILATTAATAASSKVIIDVSSATRYGQGHVFTEPTGHDGETCLVTLTETNEVQPSANPGNYLTLDTGDVHLILDIETERGGVKETSITGTVGATATLAWHIDRVSSAGASVTLDCEGVPPSTTTTVSVPTTTLPPGTTTTTKPPTTEDTTTTTSTTVPESTPVPPTVPTTVPDAPTSPPPTDEVVPPPPSTVPEPTPIPSGVPTGVGEPDSNPWPWVALGFITIGGITLMVIFGDRMRRGNDE